MESIGSFIAIFYARLYRKAGPVIRKQIKSFFLLRFLHDWVNNHLVGHVELPAPLEGYRMYGTSFMLSLYSSIGWEPEVMETIEYFVKPGGACVDVGAHYGITTLLMSKLVGSDGIVIAFEPDPDTVKILQKNIDANNCRNATIVPTALGDTEKEGALLRGTDSMFNSLVSIKPEQIRMDGNNEVAARVLTLAAFWRENNLPALDFMKMDVEGYELQVLLGAAEIIEEYHPVILTEMHAHIRGSSSQAAGDWLKEHGYAFYSITPGAGLSVRLECPIHYEQLIAIHPSRQPQLDNLKRL